MMETLADLADAAYTEVYMRSTSFGSLSIDQRGLSTDSISRSDTFDYTDALPLTSSFTDVEQAEYQRNLAVMHSTLHLQRLVLRDSLPHTRTARFTRIYPLIGTAVCALSFALLFGIGGVIGMILGKEQVVPDPDFRCHGQVADVDLDTACWRVGEVDQAGARRRLTSVPSGFSCLPQYRLRVHDTGESHPQGPVCTPTFA